MQRPAEFPRAMPTLPPLLRSRGRPGAVREAAPARCIGGGHYPRTLVDPAHAVIYRVHKVCGEGEFSTITQALAQWDADKRVGGAPRIGIIDIVDSSTYYESPVFRLDAGEQLFVRAASRERPVLRIFDYHTGESARACVVGAAGSHFRLDGLCVAGGGFDVSNATPLAGSFEVTLRHCTLVPGWDADRRAPSPWRLAPSLTLRSGSLGLHIDHSVLGPLQVCADGAAGSQATIGILRSILDGGHTAGMLIDDGHCGAARAKVSVSRSTIIGVVQVRELGLVANSMFLGALTVSQRSTGSARYCYLAPGSRTPSRMMCQPDLAQHAPGAYGMIDAQRVRPRFVSLRFGAPGYGQLGPDCASEILHGADDDSALGPVHDSHHREPQPLTDEPVLELALS